MWARYAQKTVHLRTFLCAPLKKMFGIAFLLLNLTSP